MSMHGKLRHYDVGMVTKGVRSQDLSMHGPSVDLKLHDAIEFNIDGKNMLKFEHNGDIKVKGKLISNDKEVVDTLREWLAKSVKQ